MKDHFRRYWLGYVIALVVLTLPAYASNFFVRSIATRALILGLLASSLVFLSKYAGMVSLAQTLMYGVAGFMVGNAVASGGTRGMQLGWDAWVGMFFALGITVVVSLVFGAIASRTTGIYFLMLTLTYAVIGFYFFGQVTTFSGFGGISGVTPPDVLEGPDPHLLRRGRHLDHRLRGLPRLGSDTVRSRVARGPRRPGSYVLAGFQRAVAPDHGIRPGRTRCRACRRPEHLVEGADRPAVDHDRHERSMC